MPKIGKFSASWQLAEQRSQEKRKACLIPFTDEEWHLWDWLGEEEYVVPLIKKYLRSDEQRQEMAKYDISIEDMLNGRVEGEEAHNFVALAFLDWNKKLGYLQFGG